jgi:low affinity Fe/Cu permease
LRRTMMQGRRSARRTASGHAGSLLLHVFDRWAARPSVALGIVAADVAWVVCSTLFGFPARWETIFQTMVAAITMAMVFVIQHTQAREQAATQRKLDEILSALPGASNTMITLEHAPDDDLRAAARTHRDLREQATADQGASSGR